MFSMANATSPAENKAEGTAFLLENAKKANIVTTASGLQYEIIKKGMFDKHIKNKYNVFVIVDDRPRVVRMWHSLGLPVFNVGDGREF